MLASRLRRDKEDVVSKSEPLSTGRVLEVAAKLFAERGYSKTRLKDIAEPFGVTHAALYYHFQRKEDILIQLNDLAIDGLFNMVREISASADIPPEEKFDHVIYGHALFVASNVLIVASLFDGEYALPARFAKKLRERRRVYTEEIIELFRAAQQAGRYRDGDARILVSLLLGATTWVYRWYREGRGEWKPKDVADAALGLLAEGYLREGAQLADVARVAEERLSRRGDGEVTPAGR